MKIWLLDIDAAIHIDMDAEKVLLYSTFPRRKNEGKVFKRNNTHK